MQLVFCYYLARVDENNIRCLDFIESIDAELRYKLPIGMLNLDINRALVIH